MKGGLCNDSGIGVLVDNHTALHFAGSDIPDFLPYLLKESISLRQRVGM